MSGLELAREGISRLMAARCWSLPDTELRDAVVASHELLAMAEAAHLGLLRELDGRPEAVPGARPGQAGRTFLVHALRVAPGQAGRDVEAARALDPDGGALTRVGVALAAGEVSRAHVDVAVRALGRVPAHLLAAVGADGTTGAARVDAFLAEQARALAPPATEVVARHLLAVLDPDGTDRHDPDAFLRRRLTCAVDSTGMLVGRFQLDPTGGAYVKAVLDAYAAPAPAVPTASPDGGEVLLTDDRSREQRLADALVVVARAALGQNGNGNGNGNGGPGPVTQVLVVATVEQIALARGQVEAPEERPAWEKRPAGEERPGLATCLPTGAIGPRPLAALACDSLLQAVLTGPSGAVLDLGRGVRTVSASQRKALVVRDRGCVVPACTAPVTACDAHHVRSWQDGGRSDLSNLALLCAAHHAAVHTGIWSVRMIDGLPWVVPPSWVDPARRPLRQRICEATDQARRLGVQLCLDLPPPRRPAA
jgi:hypothetical protein